MMMHLLAEAAERPDTMISGNWLLAVIPVIFTAIAGLVFGPGVKKRWQEEAVRTAKITIHPPVPTIHTKEEVQLVTKDELDSKMEEVRADIQEIKDAIEGDRKIAREERVKAADVARDSLGKIHFRVDAQAISTAEIKGEMKKMSETMSQLLTLALQGKPPTPRR